MKPISPHVLPVKINNNIRNENRNDNDDDNNNRGNNRNNSNTYPFHDLSVKQYVKATQANKMMEMRGH